MIIFCLMNLIIITIDRCNNDKAFSFISYIIILVIVGELDEVGSK